MNVYLSVAKKDSDFKTKLSEYFETLAKILQYKTELEIKKDKEI